MPTDKANALMPHALAMESSAAAMLRTASGNDDAIGGSVRITASQVIAVEVLPEILAGLSADHPDLDFELVASNETADLLRRDADIAVRMVRPSQSALVARKIGDIPLGMYARRDYLDRRGWPASIGDLEGHAIIGFDRETPSIQTLKTLGLELTRDLFSLRTDNDLAQLAALRAGFGIGICQIGLARREPRLVRLFPDVIRFPLETWVTMHEDLRASRRMRVVFDRLAEALGAYVRSASEPE